MGAPHRLTVLVACALLTATLPSCSSCKRADPPPPDDTRPPDRLGPSEVVEGKERAFGLPLPAQVQIKARFPKTVHVVSSLSPEEATNFVRARVTGGKVIPGTSVTTLAEVSPSAEPQRVLTVEVRKLHLTDGTRSELLVNDVTRAAPEPNLSNEERLRRAGLKPNGGLADPQHLQ